MNNSKPDQKLKNKYLQLLKDPNIFNIHLEDLKKMIEERTDKVKVLNEILTLSENIYESYLKASSTQKKKYLRMFFEGIHVDDRKIVRVEYNPVIADLTKIREVRLSDNWRRGWDNAIFRSLTALYFFVVQNAPCRSLRSQQRFSFSKSVPPISSAFRTRG